MFEIEEFINKYTGVQREILNFMHHWLVTEFKLTPKIKFKLPFYYGKSWICFLSPTKIETVDFSFIRGDELLNPSGILEHRGRKMVSSFEIVNLENIPFESLNQIIFEAIELDKYVPFKSIKNR